jgi:AcrR family transcriptional regulator
MKRRRLTGPERRARILAAAEEAFAQGGYDGASMGALAEAAGVTKPVLYDHFASKRELFVELITAISGEMTSRTVQAMSADAPAETRIRNAFDAFFRYVEERPAAARVLFVTPRTDPELLASSRRVQAQVTRDVAQVLAAEPGLATGRGGHRLELYAEFVKQGVNGLAEWWAEHPDVPRRSLVNAAMDIAWHGLRARLPG